MISKVKHFIVKRRTEILIVVINLIAFHKWFFNFSTLTYGDWFQRLNATSREALSLPYIWESSNLGLGGISAIPTSYPTAAMEGFLARLGFGWPAIERLLYMWPLVIVGALGSYYLIKRITKADVPSFVGSIVYSFNTYFLVLRGGHLPTMAAFAFAPLVILYFQRAMEEKKYYLAVLTGLFSWIVGIYDMRVFYIVAGVLFLYFIYHTFVIEKPNFALVKKNSLLALIPVAIMLLTNLYWILVFFRGGGFVNPLYNRGLFGNEYLNLLRAMTLFHPFWTGSRTSLFVVQPIPIYFYLIPVIAILGLVLNRKKKEVWFFGGIAVIGILLAKQVGGPFPGLYPWLYRNVPGFSLFRDATKFYLLIILGYSILIAMFVNWLWQNWSSGKWKRYGKYVLTGLIVFIFLFNAVPFVTGGFETLFTSRKIPRDYMLFQDFVLKQKDYFRTLWVPASSRWGIYTANHPLISYYSITSWVQNFGEWKDIVDSIKHGRDWDIQDQITALFCEPYFKDLLGNASVKYVIVPVRDTENDDDIFMTYGGNRDYYIKLLDRLDFLKRVDIGAKSLTVYEFTDFKPYITSMGNAFCLDTLDNLDYKYNFITSVLHGQFEFAIGGPPDVDNSTRLTNLFESPRVKDINTSDHRIIEDVTVEPGDTETRIYKNIAKSSVMYESKNGNLEVYVTKPDNLFLNNGVLKLKSGKSKQMLGSISVGPDRNYYFILNSAIYPVAAGESRSIGPLNSGQAVQLYSSRKQSNLIYNGSFEQGLWQEKVGDYNNYDNKPVLGMRLSKEEKSDGGQSLQLEAARHLAGTGQVGIGVKADTNYLLSFDYQSPNVEQAGYQLSFMPKGTQIKEAFTIKDKKWHVYSKVIKTPQGTSSIDFALLGFSGYGSTKRITRYDNVRLVELPGFDNWYYLASGPNRALTEPKDVEFENVSLTKKVVHIKSAKTSFFISMSERYHPGWRLVVNNKRISGPINGWVPFATPDEIGDKVHYKLDDVSNAWYVDLEELKRKNLVRENTDGTSDLDLAIEFWPQRYGYFGFVISVLLLLGCAAFLIIHLMKRMRSREAREASP